MAETFKQLKKGEDSAGESGAIAGNKNINKVVREMGKKKEGEGEEDDAMIMEEQAIKDSFSKKKSTVKKGEMDDDDMLSDHEQEMMDEIN